MNEKGKVAPTERELELKKRRRELFKWEAVAVFTVFNFMLNGFIRVEDGVPFAARVLSEARVQVPVVKNFTRNTSRYVLEISDSGGQRMTYEKDNADFVPGDELTCRRYRSPITVGNNLIGLVSYDCQREPKKQGK